MGFIETPYRKVTNGVVDLVSTVYLSAEEEEGMLILKQIFRWTILENYCRKRNCYVRIDSTIDL
jgi:DNA-directed RNA polymerase beta subunit